MDTDASTVEEHVQLAREAVAAGLTVTELMPMRCCGPDDYAVQFWAADGTLWAEGSHESTEMVREHIALYRPSSQTS